jgi:hypothetical protein
VTYLAFIGQAKGATLLSMEIFGGSCKITSAAETSAGRHSRKLYGPPPRTQGEVR